MEQEISLRQRLNKEFKRNDFVGVRNILNVDFEWGVALEANELLNMSQADRVDESQWIQNESGKFLPGDGPVKGRTRIVTYKLQPGEKKMVIGEAAYVLIDKMYTMYIKQEHVPNMEAGEIPDKHKLALTKAGLAKLRNPEWQKKVLKMILVGPIIDNVEGALQTYVSEKVSQIEGFSDVQTQGTPRRGRPPKQTVPA